MPSKKRSPSRNSLSSRELYDALVQFMNEGLIYVDNDDRILFVNDAFGRMTGYERDFLIGQRATELFLLTEDDRKKVRQRNLDRTKGIREQYEIRIRHANGDVLWVFINAAPIRNKAKKVIGSISIITDITAQKKADAHILESRQTFRVVTGQTGQLVYDYDVASGRIQWSGAVTSITGYTEKEFDRVGIDEWADMIHPDDRKAALDLLDEAMRRGEPYETDYRFRRRDGSYILVHDSGVFILDGQDQPTRMLGAMRDITMERHIERALLESEYRLRLALEAGRMGVWQWDVATNAVSWSERVHEIFGLKPGQFSGTRDAYLQLIHPDDRIHFQEALHTAVGQSGTCDVECRVLWPDGSIRWHEVHGRVVRDESGAPLRLIGLVSDITEKKLAESELRESEERFRELIRDLSVGVLLQGPDAEILVANRTALHLLGLTEDQLLGKTSFDPEWNVIHDDGSYFPGTMHPVPVAIRTRKPVHNAVMGVYRPIHGDRVWLLVNADPQLLPDGSIRHVLCTFTDITNQRMAEEAMRETQLRLSTIADATFEGIALTEDGIIIDSNRQLAEMVGYSVDDIIGRPVTDLVHPDDHELVMRKIRTGDMGPYELRGLHKSGRIVYGEVRARHFIYKNRRVRMSAIRDITDRKATEEMLRQNEEQYRLFSNLAADYIYTADISGDGNIRPTWVSPGFSRITGYSLEEIQQRGGWLSIVDPNEFRRVSKEIDVKLSVGESCIVEYRIRTREGAVRTLRDFIQPVVDPETGRATRVSGGVQDITEKRKLEQDLIQSQKMESIGRLAGGIAHDINNMLAVIIPTAEMLSQQAHNADIVRSYAGTITDAARRAADIIKQLLVFARQSPVRFASLDLNEVIRSSYDLMLRSRGTKSIGIMLDLENGLPSIEGDKTQIEQVLLNLVVNARDAIDENGRIVIRTRKVNRLTSPVLARQAMTDEWYAEIRVEDNGCGIAASDLPKIFEAFYTSKEVGKGTGLGLAVVKSITINHHGYVDVVSEIGKGTCFYVYLPSDRQPHLFTPTGESPLHQGSGKVLVVDDELALLPIYNVVLQEMGYSPVLASTPDDGLRAFFNDTFKLVILDVQMPGMNGFQLLRKMQVHTPDVPYLFATGFADWAELQKEKGVDTGQILFKPFTRMELSDAIRMTLRRHNISFL